MTSFVKAGIERYRRLQRTRALNQPFRFKKQYAIVGAGQHSLANLYPCLWHLGVPVKRICTQSAESAEKAAFRWKDCTGTGRLEDILSDASISAVFVSTRPQLQAGIATQLLRHNKQVFVEKPIGFSLAELESVRAAQGALLCQPGLQRRFAPLTRQLKRLIKAPISYNYRFVTGPYPEGAALYELFVHPVDFAVQLFGPARVAHASVTATDSYLLVLDHSGVKGMLELSAAYSWKTAAEEITINTATQVVRAEYPDALKVTPKPRRLGQLPLEKIFSSPVEEQIYLKHDFVPLPSSASHYRQGFYPQLAHFVQLVEGGTSHPLSRLESLVPAYKILEVLQEVKA